MSIIEEGKLYKLEGRGMIRHYTEFIILIGFIIFGIYFFIVGYQQEGMRLFSFDYNNIYKVLFMFCTEVFLLYLLIGSILYCTNGIITKNSVIGLNSYRIKRGELRFDEIEEIRSYGINYNILVKDKRGKKLILATTIQPTEPFFNEIIRRAVNCRRIDLRYIGRRYKNLLVYERGQHEQ